MPAGVLGLVGWVSVRWLVSRCAEVPKSAANPGGVIRFGFEVFSQGAA